MPHGPASRQPRKPLPPLDPETLQAIAVRYVERYQTTRQRLLRLLRQKLRQRGWNPDGPAPDLEAIASRMVSLGYVNDGAFADARARGLQRRGLGPARVRAALSAAGIGDSIAEEALGQLDPLRAALDFARRKRLGPYGPPADDQKAKARQMAAMARAGHAPGLARRILDAQSPEEAEALADDGLADEG